MVSEMKKISKPHVYNKRKLPNIYGNYITWILVFSPVEMRFFSQLSIT